MSRNEPALYRALTARERAAAGLPERAAAGRRSRAAATPSWVVELQSAFDDLPTSAHEHEPPLLVRVFEPLLARGRARLRAKLAAIGAHDSGFAYDEAAIAGLEAGLLSRVRRIAEPTLVLELNVARLQGVLSGETPQARFADFVRRLETPEMRASLVSEYPVLARHIVLLVEQWVTTSLEFIERLGGDWELLRTAFFAGCDPGPLVGIEAGQGDTHRGGRSVTIARFASGSALVYKPRSLAVDRHFYELLHWLNARAAHPALRDLCVIDRGTYGWEECVAPSACESLEHVERFYERCGAYLALFYALCANDFHYENLIAAGEHPIFIDLETLFHPQLPSNGADDAGSAAWRKIAASVLGVGLLPHPLWAAPDAAGLDISGLGAHPDQLTPFAVPMLGHVGTDSMAFEPVRVPIGGRGHRPSLRGAELEAAPHAQSIARGFAGMYRLLRERRTELLAPDGPVAAFARDEIRVVIRPTQRYADVLAASFHPDLLHDALDRETLYDKLRTIGSGPGLAAAVPDECDDLQRGDVPLFTSSPESLDLRTSSGRRIEDAFPESGLASARRRIELLDADDLAAQLWYVRAAFGGSGSQPRAIDVRRTPAGQTVDRGRLLAAAGTIGERLARLAVHAGAGTTWIGASTIAQQRLSIAPLGPDLYDGLPGVALFLAHLGAIAGERRYGDLARRALVPLREQIARGGVSGIGVLTGWGGLVYAFAQLGSLWEEPALIAEGAGYAARVAELIEADRVFDVVGGAAGAILGLLALDARAPSEPIRRIADRCGEHLVANLVPGVSGAGLTGFSHGAAGMALALLRLSAAAHDDRFRNAATALIDYERSVFSCTAQNWPDLRTSSRPASGAATNDALPAQWCHGAAGIGLARVASALYLDDPMIDAEIDIARATTERDGFGGGHSLCHGALGNLELLFVAAQRRASPQLVARIPQLAAGILDDADRNGWRCGNPAAVETPGLMTGFAGIGYALLRLAEPDRVPSVLAFDPPRGVARAANAGVIFRSRAHR